MPEEESKPPYWWALLEIIPIIGGCVGVGLIIYGAIYYKNAKLIIIGAAGILWSALAVMAMYFFIFYSLIREVRSNGHGFLDIRGRMERVAKRVEFYKFQHGEYPAFLSELDEHEWSERDF